MKNMKEQSKVPCILNLGTIWRCLAASYCSFFTSWETAGGWVDLRDGQLINRLELCSNNWRIWKE
jgi:hypothetical protein